MDIEAYYRIKEQLGQQVRIIAVSKKQPIEKISSFYHHNQFDFGENYVQELVKRNDELNYPNINWHLIGHLQSNKVKYIAPFIAMIQSVDSLNLLKTINKEATKAGKVIDCLLQIYIASEETKFGLDEKECCEILEHPDLKMLNNLKLRGLMGMASFTDNHSIVRKEFKWLKTFYDKVKSGYFSNNNDFNILSMGMSDDYQIAVDEGSNMVRIGTLIFGKRNY